MVKIAISCFLPPEEGIRHKEENIVANIEGRDLGNGTLYITESQLSWLGQQGHGFELLYPAISLHAISRDLNSFPDECLYLQVDGKMIDDEEDKQNNSDEDENEDCEASLAELRFIPANKEHLEAMFSAMSDCQALHPDENDTNSEAEDEEEGEGFYFDSEGADHMTDYGHATLQHLENIFQVGQGDVSNFAPLHANGNSTEETVDVDVAMETGQFDDADMD